MADHDGRDEGDRKPGDAATRLGSVKARLRDGLVDDAGAPPPEDEVSAVVEAKAARYVDAPIQDFTTLLVEHDSRDELRARGLHTRVPAEPAAGEADAMTTDADAARRGEHDGVARDLVDPVTAASAAGIAPTGATPAGDRGAGAGTAPGDGVDPDAVDDVVR